MTAVPPVTTMINPVRDYDWGSVTALAALQAREPAGGPEAELWMGAHPGSPSSVLVGGAAVPLPEVIAADPQRVLGADSRAAFGDALPYVFKVLAIERPLSVQVHPSPERARAVFGTAGSPYVDDAHKPELLHALTPVEALFGLRPVAEVRALFGALTAPRLAPLLAALAAADDAEADADEAALLHATLASLIGWPVEDRAALVAEVLTGARGTEDLPGDLVGWVERLAALHPTDPMVLAPLLLDLVRLAPGEVVYVPAGVPHCYLSGVGVEIMAASDNVLRCGLTSKPIAVEELLAVVDCTPRPGSAARAETLAPGVTRWAVPVQDFRLTRIELDGEADPAAHGARVVLCRSGSVTVTAGGASLPVPAGHSVFVTDAAGPVLLTGNGEAFVAAPGLS